MKSRFLLAGIACLLMLGSVACNQSASPTDTPATTTSAKLTTATTTRSPRTTTALPAVGYIHQACSVRVGAGLTYKAIGGALLGEEFTILGKQGDWYQIRFGEEVGYVSGHCLRFTPYDPDVPFENYATRSQATQADTTATTDTTDNTQTTDTTA